jgi:hypothetical protein
MKATTLLTIMVITAAGVFAYDRYKAAQASPKLEVAETAARASPAALQFDRPWGQQAGPAATSPPVAASSYQCDGRTHCSQMRSCAEATYFLQHCPNTKMDGDRDGIPCEDQWCNP